jgi:acetyl esterase/lipase
MEMSMPSIRSKLLVFVLKHRHLFKGRLRRTTSIGEATSIPKLRAEVERGAEFFGKLPEGFVLEPVRIGDLDAEWMIPPGAGKEPVLLYFHGGGLVVGSVRSHRGIVAKFVKEGGIGALVFDYALAPERPYPAALNDAVAAYEYLLAEGIAPSRIVCIGDSGGGNLCLATLLTLKQRGLPQPAGAVTLSAWTDLTNSGESWVSNAKRDTLCWKDAQTVFARMYAAGNNPADPLISPLFGDLSNLPPLLMFAGGDETMRDDTTRFARKAQEAGVEVTLRVGDGLFHCYPACAPLFPEATEAMAEIGSFLRRITEGPSAAG